MARTLFCLAAAALWLGLRAPASAAPTIYTDDDLALIVKSQSLKAPAIEKLLPLLDLRPGMTILDLGAGSGQQSYRMAEKLAGTGHVFATDIEPKLIDYVNAQARQRGLSNLQAVLVKPEGLDPFYRAHRFDLVLIYDVDNYLHDRPAFYRQLRACLAPGGRVVVVESESTPNRSFYPEDVADWPGLLARLRQEPPDGPFGRAFAPMARALHGPPENPMVRRMIVFQLNRLLDGTFFEAFLDGDGFAKSAAFEPEESSQALWMLGRLKLDGFPGKRELWDLSLGRFRQLQLLNKLLVIQELRPFLSRQAPEPYWSSAPESMSYIEHDYRVRELQSAGYALTRKQPLMPFWDVWIFH